MTIRMLGRYQIVSQLGRGAMGTVYRALDPAIERTVAIKTLNPDLANENMGEVKERFLREAKSAGRLNHPNVVTIYDVGEAGGVAYIAMEYLEGRSLRQVLDAGAPLSLHAICDIAAQIADALDYAHRSGIVHQQGREPDRYHKHCRSARSEYHSHAPSLFGRCPSRVTLY